MPAMASFCLMPDCFSEDLGMNGWAAACPTFWITDWTVVRCSRVLAGVTSPPCNRCRSLLTPSLKKVPMMKNTSRAAAADTHKMRSNCWFIESLPVSYLSPHRRGPDCPVHTRTVVIFFISQSPDT